MRRLLPASRSWYALVVSATLAACGGDGPTDPGGGNPPPGGNPPGGGGATTPANVTRANENTNGQSAAVGTAVANAPAVRVTNSAGTALPNVTVTFAVTAGGGAVGATSAQTNAQGIATAGSWTLGPTVGAQTVTATVASLTPVTFGATGTAAAPANLTASRVDIGGLTVKCAVRSSGVVSCWGENPNGNLGDGTQTFREFPVNVNITGVTFGSTALGGSHGCALTAAGAAYCWGENGTGAVGDGTTTDRLSPVAVSGTHTFDRLAAGASYTCGVKADGTVWCWGQQSGGAVATQRLVPTQLATGGRTITVLSITSTQVCGAVSTGGVMCWTGDIFAAGAPSVVSSGLTFTALAGGGQHQCGIVTDGRAYCWGLNDAGQLGNNDPALANRTAPTLVSGPYRYTAIDLGDRHACALGTDNVTYCWGTNVSGQLGVNELPTTLPFRAFPSAVAAPSGVQFQQIAAGGQASCAVAATSGEVYCWGGSARDNSAQVLNASAVPVVVRDR